MEIKDTYKTIEGPSEETLFKDRGSKFFGYAFPVSNEDEIKEHLHRLKKEHHTARHWCYAWQLGTDKIRFRANDDGEPSNSAGQPIYGQILSKEITNVLIVVVRYFGGTKLGVGGLINAYRTGAQMALDASSIVERTIDVHFQLTFDYPHMNKVMRVIKDRKLDIVNQKMELQCEYIISVRKKDAENVKIQFEELRCLKIIEI
ncbi:IMPACT family protein [Aureivirga sp. CE67]|uniref:IMPACT family protein n=1 Tax=Aureivirga sp. CE67 TaxID=1788983 RepID=UPI0018CA5ED6|nr:YigZ family protein [Aureivirga sp. CE67]